MDREDSRPTTVPIMNRLGAALGARSTEGFFRQFAAYLPSQAVVAVAGLLVLPLLARKLEPTELGVLVIAQNVIAFGWLVSGNWLVAALIRELPAHRQAQSMAAFSRTLLGGLRVVFALLAVFAVTVTLASLVSGAIRDNLALIIAATVGLTLQNIGVCLFAADLRSVAYAVGNVVGGTSGIALGAYFVFEGHKVQGYLLGLAIAWLVVGVVTLAVAWPTGHVDRSAESHLGPWFNYGMAASTSSLALWGLSYIDRYMLAALKTTGDVGIYTVGNVIGDRAVTIPALAFFFASRPLLVNAYERHGRGEVERLMRMHTSILLLIGLPAVALVGATAHDLVPLLTANQSQIYAGAAVVAPIVAIGSLLFALALVAGTGLVIAKKTPLLITAAVIGLAVNVIANLILIPPFGINGAAISTPIGTGAYLIAIYTLARPYARWRFPVSTFLQALTAACLAFVAGRSLAQFGNSRFEKVAIAVLACGFVYSASVLLIRRRLHLAR